MSFWNIDSSWCLFLDRDGVVNTRKIGGYIETVSEFEFLPGVTDAIAEFSKVFKHIFIVTNQQGIGKGLMTESNLLDIHRYMTEQVETNGGKITKCYHAPDLDHAENHLRKPNVGMGILAQRDFLGVDFSKSVMIGDSDTDIQFGIKLGMKTVRVGTEKTISTPADLTLKDLEAFKQLIVKGYE